MPRVSVITAARDAERDIGRALDSVVAQSYGDWEVVVVDDASRDATGEVAASFGSSVRVIRLEDNVGPAQARNIAVEHAKGELVAILDADDFWEPDYLDHQVALVDRERSRGVRLGLAACDARLLGPDGYLPETFGDRVGRPRRATLTALLRRNFIWASVLLPRAVFRELGGYDIRMPPFEDYDLWLRITTAGYEVVRTDRALGVYAMGEQSLMSDAARAARSGQRVYEAALERGGLTPSQRRVARRQLRLHHLLERRAQTAAARRSGARLLRARLAQAPLTALVALEHPGRWLGWLLRGGPVDPEDARAVR